VKPILPDKTMIISRKEIKGDMLRMVFTETKITEKGFVENSRGVACNAPTELSS
jgi:hypothetical protein